MKKQFQKNEVRIKIYIQSEHLIPIVKEVTTNTLKYQVDSCETLTYEKTKEHDGHKMYLIEVNAVMKESCDNFHLALTLQYQIESTIGVVPMAIIVNDQYFIDRTTNTSP